MDPIRFVPEVAMDPEPESKICEKLDPDQESLFNFGSNSSLRGHF